MEVEALETTLNELKTIKANLNKLKKEKRTVNTLEKKLEESNDKFKQAKTYASAVHDKFKKKLIDQETLEFASRLYREIEFAYLEIKKFCENEFDRVFQFR